MERKRKELEDLRKGEEFELDRERQAALEKVHKEVWKVNFRCIMYRFAWVIVSKVC